MNVPVGIQSTSADTHVYAGRIVVEHIESGNTNQSLPRIIHRCVANHRYHANDLGLLTSIDDAQLYIGCVCNREALFVGNVLYVDNGKTKRVAPRLCTVDTPSLRNQALC